MQLLRAYAILWFSLLFSLEYPVIIKGCKKQINVKGFQYEQTKTLIFYCTTEMLPAFHL